MESTEAGAGREDVRWSATIVEDPRHYLIEDPRFIRTVSTSAFLQRYVFIGPALPVVTLHAVELDPAAVDEIRYHVDHAPRFEVFRLAHLMREDEDRTAPMPVRN